MMRLFMVTKTVYEDERLVSRNIINTICANKTTAQNLAYEDWSLMKSEWELYGIKYLYRFGHARKKGWDDEWWISCKRKSISEIRLHPNIKVEDQFYECNMLVKYQLTVCNYRRDTVKGIVETYYNPKDEWRHL